MICTKQPAFQFGSGMESIEYVREQFLIERCNPMSDLHDRWSQEGKVTKRKTEFEGFLIDHPSYLLSFMINRSSVQYIVFDSINSTGLVANRKVSYTIVGAVGFAVVGWVAQ